MSDTATLQSEDNESIEEQIAEEEIEDGRQWYVVHTYSGYENKVEKNLKTRIQSMDMGDRIFRVHVPKEEEIEVKNGQRRTVERKTYPGYVLVLMKLDEDSWHAVRNTPGVTGFVSVGNDPKPLEKDEVKKIMGKTPVQTPRVKIGFQKGQSVRIIDGPFTEFIGTVDDINQEKGKVRVLVSFFGRETPVDLDFLQVEKS
jgi:transcriptional antiterminator NusG